MYLYLCVYIYITHEVSPVHGNTWRLDVSHKERQISMFPIHTYTREAFASPGQSDTCNAACVVPVHSLVML